jgi:hypothetical protein
VKQRCGRPLQLFRRLVRLLSLDGLWTFVGKIVELALEGGLVLDVVDHFRDASLVLGARKVLPAGERLKVYRVRSCVAQTLEGAAPAPIGVLPGTVEPVTLETFFL